MPQVGIKAFLCEVCFEEAILFGGRVNQCVNLVALQHFSLIKI